MHFVFPPIIILLLIVSFSAQAKMYKWIDEDGQMHFGDKIPAKYLVKEHEELNDRGLTMRHREAAKTEEERQEEKRIAKEQKAIALEKKKQRQRDRVLLDTYTTVSDLEAAKEARLDAVDTQIRLAESIIADSNKKIASLEKNVVSIQASNREVPDDMYKRINSQKRQIKTHGEVMAKHKVRHDEILKQFDGYIERFKILKAEQKAKRERIARERAAQH